MKSAFAPAPVQSEQSRDGSYAPRWRGAVEDEIDSPPHERTPLEVQLEEVLLADAYLRPPLGEHGQARASSAQVSGDTPRQSRRSDSERPKVRKAGEFGSLEAFLGDLGLGRLTALFQARGLDSIDAIVALDPRRLRA